MLRPGHLSPARVTAAVVALLTLAYALRSTTQPGSSAPQTVDDMIRIAEELGLHHRSDCQSGSVSDRLVISDQPLTFERANLVWGDLDHPCWTGTVAACTPWRGYTAYCDGEHGVVFGRVFLYGDPALIRRLIAGQPGGNHGE